MESKKILIIEDDVNFRQLLVKTFGGGGGYEVYEASDGQSGLALAKQGGFAVILTDLKMPNMDGLTLIRELVASQPQVPNGPIVVLSSMVEDYVREEASRIGAKAFFNKHTMEPAELVENVGKIIEDNPLEKK